MEKITFDIELVTPMFMGGADPKAGPPEFRAASLKGLLRFWFRAIYPERLQEEGRLFGETDNRSPLVIRAKTVQSNSISLSEPALAYLGYGLYQTNRSGFGNGSSFSIEFIFRRGMSEDDRKTILNSFWALAMFGGLGSRNRRGFGSFKIVNIKAELDDFPIKFAEHSSYLDYMKNQRVVIPNKSKRLIPEHTFFSWKSRIVVSNPAINSIEAWKEIGKQFQGYRNYKKNDIAKDDHDMMLKFLWYKAVPSSAPARAAFGLPHNYFFREKKDGGQIRPRLKGGVDLLQEDRKPGRRASPLLIHIQEFADTKASAVVTFLPAWLTPVVEWKGKKVRQQLRISGQHGDPKFVNPPDFSVVEGFLDSLIAAGAEVVL